MTVLTWENLQKATRSFKDQKITILGHDNIDVDSVLSGILLSKLLNFLEIKNEFLILEKIKKTDTYVVLKELFGIDMKVYEETYELTNRNLFLVDHYETRHKGNVVAIIDHHPTLKQLNCEFRHIKNSCATAYMIYEMMKLVGYNFTKEDIKMVIVAMLIDTVSFRSTKTVCDETYEAIKLAKEYEIDFDFLEMYSLRLTQIENMTEEEIISNGEKWYSYNRKNDVSSSYLQLYEFPSTERRTRWIELIREKITKNGAQLAVFIIYDMENSRTYVYQITKEKTKITMHNGILSRGKDIMPKIEEKISCY